MLLSSCDRDYNNNDNDNSINTKMERMNTKFKNLKQINCELVQEGCDMKLYVATMVKTLTRKDKVHGTAETQFQT